MLPLLPPHQGYLKFSALCYVHGLNVPVRLSHLSLGFHWKDPLSDKDTAEKGRLEIWLALKALFPISFLIGLKLEK